MLTPWIRIRNNLHINISEFKEQNIIQNILFLNLWYIGKTHLFSHWSIKLQQKQDKENYRGKHIGNFHL